jgi:hypothetical protein
MLEDSSTAFTEFTEKSLDGKGALCHLTARPESTPYTSIRLSPRAARRFPGGRERSTIAAMSPRCIHGILLSMLVLSGPVSCGGSGDDGSKAGTCDPIAFAMLETVNSEAKVCSATTRCIADKCSDKASKCAGLDYAKGSYAGLCPSFYGCVKTCNCDKTCFSSCDPDSLECASCLTDLSFGCTLSCVTEIASCGKK